MTEQITSALQQSLGDAYRIERELDSGGMSRLFLATDVRLGRSVIVKVLPPELITAASTRRFEREIEVTTKLQHPHILPILSAGEWEDGLYYVTPFIAGESLRQRLDAPRPLGLASALQIFREIATALAFAHANGIVHRDVKPANILLSDGHAVLGDFGIARALATDATSLTAGEMRPGTPAYMAPEMPVDEHADLFALGIVGYEMLVGRRPPPSPAARSILSALTREPDVDTVLARRFANILEKMLAADPAKRFASAQAVLDTLAGTSVTRSRTRALLAVGLVAGSVVALGVVLAAARSNLSRSRLDPVGYSVLPFAPATVSDSGGPTGVAIAALLRDAIGEWSDVHAAGENRLGVDARPGEIRNWHEALAASRRAGTRYLVWGEVGVRADSVRLTATLYDAARDSALRMAAVAWPSRQEIVMHERTRALASMLLRGRDEVPPDDSSRASAPSLAAWRAYDAGRVALSAWDLTEAAARFDSALARDPNHAAAWAWAAQTTSLKGDARDIDRLGRAASRAVELARQLSTSDRIRADGLLALSRRQFAAACDAFDRLTVLESNDAAAWFNLGDCQRGNNSIVRAAGKPGWRFATSFESASRSYRRAADAVAPQAEPRFFRRYLDRLSAVLFTEPYHLRSGIHVDGPDTTRYAAQPYLDADTVAFHPRTLQEIAVGAGDPAATLIEAAIVRNRSLLRGAVERWVKDVPNDPTAYQMLANSAELAGDVSFVRPGSLTAIEAARRASRLATDSAQRIQLALTEIRLLVKAREFNAARVLGDSLLQAYPRVEGPESDQLAGLAALLGRTHRAAGLLRSVAPGYRVRTQSGGILAPAAPLGNAALALLAYASVGAPAESIKVLVARTRDLIPSYVVGEAARADAARALLSLPLSFLDPRDARLLTELGTIRDPLIGAHQALATGDTARARQLRSQMIARAAQHLPGSVAADGTYRLATISLALGDTAAAIKELDVVLQALPTLGQRLLDQLPQAAALCRSMLLRARLARARGDRETAKLWASALSALWATADSELRPIIDELSAMR